MPADRAPFQYAAIRVVPRVERGELVNAGVVLFCRPRQFLGARTQLDERLLAALSPKCDPADVRAKLKTIDAIAPVTTTMRFNADGEQRYGAVGVYQKQDSRWLPLVRSAAW